MSSRSAALVAFAVSLALLTTLPSFAFAKQARLFAGSFGEATSTPADPYPLQEAGSVAVDSYSHDFYVADAGNYRVEKFDPSGHFLFMLGQEVNKTAAEESATRSAEENICPAAGRPADVCQSGTAGAGAGAFLDPQYLAVDNSASPSKGDLYVGNTGEVDEQQTVTVTATGGTFALSFEGETTAPIPFNAESANEVPGTLVTALHARPKMTGIDPTGNPGKYTLDFIGPAVAGRGFSPLACDGSALSGPGASCVVEATRQGYHANLVEKFDPSGQPVTSWGEGGELNGAAVMSPPAPVAGPFKQVQGIAVDTSGNLWVNAPGRAFEFRNDSNFLTGWSGGGGAEIAVDSEDNLYFQNAGIVGKLSSSGSNLGAVAPSKTEVTEQSPGARFTVQGEGFDVATGDLYLDGREGEPLVTTLHGVIKRYDASCRPVLTLEFPEPGCAPVEVFGVGLISSAATGLAVDPASESIYVADEKHVTAFALETVPDVTTTKPASPTHTSATLTGTVNPSGIGLNPGADGCRFEWGETSAPYQHTEVPCDKTAAQIGSGGEPIEVHADISGLQAGKTYHSRLVASNPNDVNASIDEPSFGADVSFGPPLIESAFAVDVASVEAKLQVQLDPNDLDTHVRVEYGSEAGVYTQSTPAVDIGSAGSSQVASFELVGLAPDTSYHYRAVAENVLAEASESVAGSDQTFTTQAASAFSLLDDRAWELVSPPNKHGAKIEVSHGFAGPIQAAASGEAITYFATAPTEASPAGYANSVQVLSARSASGWDSHDIATPNHVEVGGTKPSEYRFFSSDLSLSIAEPNGEFVPEISPAGSEQTPYLRSDFLGADPTVICTSSCYRPLVSGCPAAGHECAPSVQENADVPEGTVFGYENKCVGEIGMGHERCGPQFLGATPDLTHVVLNSASALSPGADETALYEWSAGQLQLISLLPGGGGPSTQNTYLGNLMRKNFRHAISTDGSRVVWSEQTASGAEHVYLRDVPSEETLQLDVNHGGSGKGPAKAQFQDASADDSVIFFTDEQRLTPNSSATPGEPDLYSCQVVVGEAGELECALTDLSPANGAESAAVQGSDLGAGDDGSAVYFVANGVLAHNQVDNGAGEEEAEPGDCGKGANEEQLHTDTCNLYVTHEGTPTFIASLSGEDVKDWVGPHAAPTRVSPDGQWLELMSERSLTGYDNRDLATGRRAAEVYLYHAAGNGPGTLSCASCDPTGARPRGIEYHKLEFGLGGLDGNTGSWESAELVAASVPGWNSVGGNAEEGGNQPRYLTDSGRVFFDAEDGLVPQDTNGTEDVYEYEPAGVGTCSNASVTFGVRSGGCVDMISSGTSGEESDFLDASEDGNDVFFLTVAQLSRRDTDTAYDVYDARVEGGEPEAAKPVECQGDACAGFVAAPNDSTPGSLTFQGPGNLNPLVPVLRAPVKKTAAQLRAERLAKALKACRKDRSKRRRAQCELSARGKHGAARKSAKRVSHDRGAKR
jgi:hypothetical protein